MSSKTTEIIRLNGEDIEFIIENKNIKNTYFRFRDGKVYISKSKRMSIKKLGKYIHENKNVFIQKTKQSMRYVTTNTMYYLFGSLYQILESDKMGVCLNDNSKTISFSSLKLLDRFEKETLHKQILTLHHKYINNPFVSLEACQYSVRNMKSRYGSCQPSSKKIHINQKLIHYPKHYLEYVFCHEIAHLNEANHSKKFYDLLEKLYPNYKAVRKELKQG